MDVNLLAAAAESPATELIKKINGAIVNPIIFVMFACALFMFLWGVRAYITGADNQEVRQKGANQMLWGIIGMAIMMMTFGLIRIILQTFGITSGSSPESQQTKEAVEKILN